MKTLYTQVVTTRKLTDMGNLLDTHRTLDTHAIMMMTVHGISLARGDARRTTRSDGLAEHLERMDFHSLLRFQNHFFFLYPSILLLKSIIQAIVSVVVHMIVALAKDNIL
jgi:hypothetical protein